MEAGSRAAFLFVLMVSLIPLAGCEVIGGIFRAGVWVGVILAAILVVGIMWVVRRAGR